MGGPAAAQVRRLAAGAARDWSWAKPELLPRQNQACLGGRLFPFGIAAVIRFCSLHGDEQQGPDAGVVAGGWASRLEVCGARGQQGLDLELCLNLIQGQVKWELAPMLAVGCGAAAVIVGGNWGE